MELRLFSAPQDGRPGVRGGLGVAPAPPTTHSRLGASPDEFIMAGKPYDNFFKGTKVNIGCWKTRQRSTHVNTTLGTTVRATLPRLHPWAPRTAQAPTPHHFPPVQQLRTRRFNTYDPFLESRRTSTRQKEREAGLPSTVALLPTVGHPPLLPPFSTPFLTLPFALSSSGEGTD